MKTETIESLKKVIEYQESVIAALKDVLVKSVTEKEKDRFTFVGTTDTFGPSYVKSGPWTLGPCTTNIGTGPYIASNYWTESTTIT